MASYSDSVADDGLLDDATALRIDGLSTVEAFDVDEVILEYIATSAIEAAVLDDAITDELPSLAVDSAVLNDGTELANAAVSTTVETALLDDSAWPAAVDLVDDDGALDDAVALRVAGRDSDAAILDDETEITIEASIVVTDSGVLDDEHEGSPSNEVADSFVGDDALFPSASLRSFATDSAILDDGEDEPLAADDVAVDEDGVLDDATTDYLAAVDEISDVGELDDRYVGSGWSGWAAQTELWAMSRLSGLEFESAAMVDGKLVALSAAGAFLLEGDDDDGVPIAASLRHDWIDITQGESEPATNRHMKRPRYVYCTLTGEVSVSIAASDNGTEESYDYALPAATGGAMATRRAAIGRGMRSRFLRPSISNVAGSDFSLVDARIVVDSLRRSV
jgi:hypothetical protein